MQAAGTGTHSSEAWFVAVGALWVTVWWLLLLLLLLLLLPASLCVCRSCVFQHYKRLPVGQVVAGQTAALALKKIKRAQVSPHTLTYTRSHIHTSTQALWYCPGATLHSSLAAHHLASLNQPTGHSSCMRAMLCRAVC